MSEAANNPCPIPAKAGIGLRFQHHQVVLDVRPDVAWMEVHTENYMGGGTPLRYLDDYGAEFPEFLRSFEPAAALVYLGDVARLEWAVGRALHAADVEPLDLKRLAALAPQDQARVCLVPHPSVGLLAADYPVDAIWRGVLDEDDAALAAVALDAGPVRLLVERRATGVEVSRLDEAAWCFATALFDGWSVEEAVAAAAGASAGTLLAEHLAAGRFVDFHLVPAKLGASFAATHKARP